MAYGMSLEINSGVAQMEQNDEELLKKFNLSQNLKGEEGAQKTRTPSYSRTTNKAIEEKRQELEMKKLEIEIRKLEKPDTNLDYYGTLIKMQENYYKQLLEMQQKQQALQLEITKLQSMSGSEEDTFFNSLEMFMPLIEKVVAQKGTQTPVQEKKQPDGTTITPPIQTSEKEAKNNVMVTNKISDFQSMEEVKAAIKAGKIEESEAWDYFRTTKYKDVLNREQFKAEFEKIKNEK